MKVPERNTVETFWSRVERGPDCWLWTGKLDDHGYGRMSYVLDGKKDSYLAPRLAWYFAHGEYPYGRCVLHHCDTRRCVRIEHLFLGDRAANNADRDAKGRQSKGDQHWSRTRPANLRRGEAHGRAKLTADNVREARVLRAEGWKWIPLAARYGVTHHAIQLAVRGITWKTVA